jgi:hypothetical protein
MTSAFHGFGAYTSDYKFEKIYYRSIAERGRIPLPSDYLWRWDTDWFWCSKNVLAQNMFFRKYFGKRLGSRTYEDHALEQPASA